MAAGRRDNLAHAKAKDFVSLHREFLPQPDGRGVGEASERHSINAYSAGVEPHGMNQRAVAVMQEAGVDISSQRSKRVDELKHVPFDFVVTVCDHAHETCPLFPGTTKILHVGFDDPPMLAKRAKTEQEALDHYRRVRDEIRRFVEHIEEYLPKDA